MALRGGIYLGKRPVLGKENSLAHYYIITTTLESKMRSSTVLFSPREFPFRSAALGLGCRLDVPEEVSKPGCPAPTPSGTDLTGEEFGLDIGILKSSQK